MKTIFVLLFLFLCWASCTQTAPSPFELEFERHILIVDSVFLEGKSVTDYHVSVMKSLSYLEKTTGIPSQLKLQTFLFYSEYPEDRQKWLCWLERNKN